MSIQHLDNNKGRLLSRAASSVCVALEYTAVALDEPDHDLVADILVLQRFETRGHAGKEGGEENNLKHLDWTAEISPNSNSNRDGDSKIIWRVC